MAAGALKNDVVEVEDGKTIAQTAIDSVRRRVEKTNADDTNVTLATVFDPSTSMSYPVQVVRRIVYEARGLRGELHGEHLCGDRAPRVRGDSVTVPAGTMLNVLLEQGYEAETDVNRPWSHYWEDPDPMANELDGAVLMLGKAVWIGFTMFVIACIAIAVYAVLR